MGDISTWNPVDNSNTTAPPDGWPENMAPSAVNNSARAMMGAVRRWYDTVTAQLASLTSSLANYLPLSGGTLSGGLHAPYLHSTGNVQADNAVTSPAMTATGTIQANQLTSTGNINASGTVTAGQLTSTGNINATNDIGARDIYLRDGHYSGTVQAAQLTSTGNINAAGSVAGADLYATNYLYLSGAPSLSVTTGNQLNVFTTTGQQALVIYGNPTNLNSYFNNLHSFGNMGNTVTFAQFSGGGCFNVNGGWGILSDASLKDEVSAYNERGLEAILALSPVSFRYKAGTPFADPERTLRYGLIAQDVAGIIPEMVGETTLDTGGAVATMFPGHLVYVLVNAAKELAARNAALAARITALEGNHV